MAESSSGHLVPIVGGKIDSARGPGAREVWWLDRIAEPRVAFPFLLAFAVAIFIVNLGGYPIYTRGEPREAIRIVDIVGGGGVILPTQTGIGLPWKPPLMYWLGALISVLAGRVNEWTVRLPSAMLAVAGIAVCYYYVGRLFDRRSALVAALILATSFEYLQAASAARVDMTLTFFMEVAFFEFLLIAEGLVARRMLLYLALAAAILAKGPIGAFLPGLVALIWMLLEGRLRLLRDLKLPTGTAVVAVVAGGWYLLAGLKGGMDFVHRQILDENLYRLLPSHAVREPHAHPFYYMELMLIAGFLPWSAIAPLAVVQLVREPRALSARVKYLMVWLVAVLVFYNLPQSKRGVYLLALYPALAAITALFLNETFSRPDFAAPLVRGLKWVSGLLLLAVALAALLLEAMTVFSGSWLLMRVTRGLHVDGAGFAQTLIATVAARPVASVFLPLAAAASGVYLLRSKVLVEGLFAGTLVGCFCVVIAARLVVVPAIAGALTLKPFALELAQIVDGKSVASLEEEANFDIAFYSRRDIPVVSYSEAGRSNYLLCSRRSYDLQPEKFRERFVSALESGPTNFRDGGRMLLLRRAGLPDSGLSP
jgi:4-amino-4-deoxy-L-arabinose transferase-like glycosyltransferase